MATWVHGPFPVGPGGTRSNTKAAPASVPPALSLSWAPTTAVPPSIETLRPKRSLCPVLLLVSLATWVAIHGSTVSG